MEKIRRIFPRYGKSGSCRTTPWKTPDPYPPAQDLRPSQAPTAQCPQVVQTPTALYPQIVRTPTALRRG